MAATCTLGRCKNHPRVDWFSEEGFLRWHLKQPALRVFLSVLRQSDGRGECFKGGFYGPISGGAEQLFTGDLVVLLSPGAHVLPLVSLTMCMWKDQHWMEIISNEVI